MMDYFHDVLIWVSVLYAGMVVVLYIYMLTRLKRKKVKDRKTFDLLQQCILNRKITDSFGFDLLCKASEYEDFEQFVKKFLKFSLESLSEEEYHIVESFIRSIMIDKSKKKPFEGCSSNDKQMLLVINDIIAESDNEAAKYSVQELSRSLKEKDQKIRKQRISQIVLTILTILGLAINIIFGVIGMNLSENDLQNIQQTVEQVLQSDTTNNQIINYGVK